MLMPKRVKRRKQMRGRLKGRALRGNKITYGDVYKRQVKGIGNYKGLVEKTFTITSKYYYVTGVVRYNSGRVIKFAKITLTGTDYLGNSVTRTTKTDKHGKYTFNNLKKGKYVVTYLSLIHIFLAEKGIEPAAGHHFEVLTDWFGDEMCIRDRNTSLLLIKVSRTLCRAVSSAVTP